MWLTTILTSLIFIECVAVVYIPSYVENKISKIKKNKFVNMENFENIASGKKIKFNIMCYIIL